MGAQNSSLFFFLGGIIVLIILLILLFVYWMIIKRRSPQEAEEKMEKEPSIMSQHQDEVVKVTFSSKQQPGSMDFFSGSLGTISHFNLNTLRRATRNFHSKNLLGSGGFGPVYQVLVHTLFHTILLCKYIVLPMRYAWNFDRESWQMEG
ncbi:hypothetical protein S83_037275 [Arachis hypogaea]